MPMHAFEYLENTVSFYMETERQQKKKKKTFDTYLAIIQSIKFLPWPVVLVSAPLVALESSLA